jgi:hypothetical protein
MMDGTAVEPHLVFAELEGKYQELAQRERT